MEIQEHFVSQSCLSLGGEETSVLDMMSGSSPATEDIRSQKLKQSQRNKWDIRIYLYFLKKEK